MATQTLTAPPGPFSCTVCSLPQWAEKAGPACQTCPAFRDTHYHPNDIGVEAPDIVILGDNPAPPKPVVTSFMKEVKPLSYHPLFEDAGGKIVKLAVDRVLSRREFSRLLPFYTYAVKCAVPNAKKEVIQQCSNYFLPTLRRIADRRQEAGRTTPLVILACGKVALAALGIRVGTEEEALNRVYENQTYGGVNFSVVPTRSLAGHTASGKFNMLMADVERAALLASDSLVRVASRSDVEKEYIYPTSIREVEELVTMVIGYAQDNIAPSAWPISFDTETNTLHPNWEGTKLLSVSFAWAKGKAASVALWHPQNSMYDPVLAYEEVKRLLQSQKPLIWHNGKYDYKVFWRLGWPQGDVGNPYWDTMLAEHALEEDKKQGYSLKVLTKQRIPELAGYEDVLQSMLEKENDELRPEEVADEREAEEDAEESDNPLGLARPVLEAFNQAVERKLIKSPLFRAATLEKVLPTWEEKEPEFAKALKLLISAKKQGEFTANGAKKVSTKQDTGGFESIPLSELMFYGAVDADATRRIAVGQSQRMAAEDKAINARRQSVALMQKVTRDPRDKQFPVQVLCTHPKPLRRLVQEDYLPRQRELAKIEYNGINIDLKYLDQGMAELVQTVDHSANEVYRIAGGDAFKIGSTQRLAQLFFSEGFVHPDGNKAAALAEKYPNEVYYDGKRVHYKAFAYTAKGAIQTSESVLKALTRKYECPLANMVLTYKKAYKARTTFFANIRELARYFGDDHLRAGYGLINTSTGRLSSRVKIGKARFNAQNVPKGWIGALKDYNGEYVLDANGKRVFEGVNCKKLFITDHTESMAFTNFDAKGAEVTIYAAYSKDPALIEALRAGLDPHCFFGSECLNPALVGAGLVGEQRKLALSRAGIDDHHAWTYADFLAGKDCNYGKPLPDGTICQTCATGEHAYCKRLKALRDNIKRLVFGMLYGAGITKIAEIAGISLEFAKKIQELLFTKFPTIRTFMERTKWELRTFNLVEAFNGRRRRFLLGAGAPSDLRAQAERQAINFKVQGTSSDIVLSVLCWLAPVIERDLGGRLLLTVHDSIGAQVPKKYAGQLKDLVYEYGTKRVEQACPWLPSPYRWDVEMGPSYGELSDVAQYIAGLPPNTLEEGLGGYVEEEQFDDLRDLRAFSAPDSRKAKKVA